VKTRRMLNVLSRMFGTEGRRLVHVSRTTSHMFPKWRTNCNQASFLDSSQIRSCVILHVPSASAAAIVGLDGLSHPQWLDELSMDQLPQD